MVVLVVVVVEAAGAIELSVVVDMVLSVAGVAVVVSVVVVFSAVLVEAFGPHAATERAATAAVATRILRIASEVMSLVPLGG